MDLFDIAVASKLAGGGGGGGGASNIVTGTFKGTENGILSVSVPYTGEGYPLAILIYVKDGIDCSGTDFYNVLCQGTMAQWLATKVDMSSAPNYPESGGTVNTSEKWDCVSQRKSSSTNAHNFTQTGSRNINGYVKTNPLSSASDVVKMWSSTEFKVKILNNDYGFYPNIDFAYVITYSS